MFCTVRSRINFSFFFFNDTATTEIYTLSLHDALPISLSEAIRCAAGAEMSERSSLPSAIAPSSASAHSDRKSTRLNSSHLVISYAVFCLKKKKNQKYIIASKNNRNVWGAFVIRLGFLL